MNFDELNERLQLVESTIVNLRELDRKLSAFVAGLMEPYIKHANDRSDQIMQKLDALIPSFQGELKNASDRLLASANKATQAIDEVKQLLIARNSAWGKTIFRLTLLSIFLQCAILAILLLARYL